MAEKVIRDGSEVKKAKYNTISIVTCTVFLLTGIMFLVLKGMSEE